MFWLLWVIFRHKFQELFYTLFYSFYVLQFFVELLQYVILKLSK